ncbi:hypothetical protein LZ31DRAFT_551006 [Colletotrichum somersetense]|nr:hypothetical protein LZ31DRAFT_551006 [Colletotrichum somersetense]
MGLAMLVACCRARRVRPIPSQSPPVARIGGPGCRQKRASGYDESLFSLSRNADDAIDACAWREEGDLRAPRAPPAAQRSGDDATRLPRDFAMGS